MIITHPRQLHTETPLHDQLVVVAAPRSAHGLQAANTVLRAMKDAGVRVVLHEDPEDDLLRAAAGPVIVVGNLADSRCVRSLYYNSLCATDLWYPGPAGYELRTLCDPFGTGHNVVLVGYSDAEGARSSSDALAACVGEVLPHLKTLRVTRLPMAAPEVEEIRNEPLPESDWMVASDMLGDDKGYLYYLTGDPELGEAYRSAWRAFVACGYETNERLVQTHLYSLSRFLPWRLVEDMDLFNTDERLAITRFFHGWAESEEGWQYVANCRRVQSPAFPRQNHELIPALALLYAQDYYETHYPDIVGTDKWGQTGHRVYAPYGSSWKPLCDGLCHGWWMSQPVMLEYALRDPTHRYFEEGGARHAANCAMAVVNNRGWLPTAGDCDLRRQFPGPSLRVAAAYYGEGQYRYVHDMASTDRQLARLTTLPRAFDVGVKAEVPEEMIGVTVVPVDPLIYHVWDSDPEMAPLAVRSAPTVPIEQCFDKLAVRVGWDASDDFFLMDGLGGGSHSYDDAAGILEYARLGVSLIVQEDSFVQSAPEHHSTVTVVRDGEAGLIPGFAILEAHETGADGGVYLRVRLADYAGADWVREVHLFPGRCAVFVDTVTANTAGDFAVEAHFRTPTRLRLEGRGAVGRRKSPCTYWVDVRLESLCAPSCLGIAEEPVHLRYQKASDKDRWLDRYYTDEMLLTSFTAREANRLEPGESVRLVHLVQGCASGERVIHLETSETEVFISDGETRERLNLLELDHPAERTPDVGRLAGGIKPNVFYDAEDRITAMLPLEDDLVAVGTETGMLRMVNDDGREIWRTQIDGPVRDIGGVQADTLVLAAGHGLDQFTCFDQNGDRTGSTRIIREPCPWPWWELPTPAVVQVAGGVSEGEPFFVVGCGDIQVRCFDVTGTEQWRWRYNEGVPGRIMVTDAEEPGESRVLVGGDILSDQSTLRVLDPKGALVSELPVEGWTSMLTALAVGSGKGNRLIACGASRGENLHLFSLNDEKWESRWLKRLGGQVTGICIQEEEGLLFAGTSQGFLLCYDLDGTVIWHRLFDRGIQHVVELEDDLLVVDQSGDLKSVSTSGDVAEMGGLDSPCPFALSDGTRVTLASGSEIFRT